MIEIDEIHARKTAFELLTQEWLRMYLPHFPQPKQSKTRG